jgi:hypothetical protein
MQCHRFRKYFETTAKNQGMDTLILIFNIALWASKQAWKTHTINPMISQILEGNDKMLGYISVMSGLTINQQKKKLKN